MENFAEKASKNLRRIKEVNPLVHTITNYVTMNSVANALIAVGASPVMAFAVEEVEDIVSKANALVINIGTLSPDRIDGIITAGQTAMARKVPIIFDPVGAGSSRFRTDTAKMILKTLKVRVVRANPSEFLSLESPSETGKGVDSMHTVEQALVAAKRLSFAFETAAAITGPTDLVVFGNRIIGVRNGHRLLSKITGTGCTASALIGAFISVDPDPLTATVSALCLLGIAGELAAQLASGPGSFQVQLLDALYTITPETIRRRCLADSVFSV